MKKLSSFILIAFLFISALFFVSPNAFAVNNKVQPYVDNNLVGAGLTQGFILSPDGTQLGVSSGVTVSDSEAKALIDLFKTPQNAFTQGITFNNVKYIATKATSEQIYAQKGTSGIVAVKNPKVIVIGAYNNTLRSDNAARLVEQVADYLGEEGY